MMAFFKFEDATVNFAVLYLRMICKVWVPTSNHPGRVLALGASLD
jgi:hypothetical protein